MRRDEATKRWSDEGRKATVSALRAVLVLSLLVVAGCIPKPVTPKGYYGPTESMVEVARRINANNQAIPTLFARISYIDINIVDPKTRKSTFVNADGTLFVRKPRELLLRGRKAVQDAFEIGSTDDRYWLSVPLQEDTMWWGWYRNIGKPCAAEMPIRPDAVGEVLGIGDIGADLLQLPAPVMRFNNDLDVYMITWQEKTPDHWYATREIWYDRATLRPRKVLLFDRNGRDVLRANLSEHVQVQLPGKTPEQLPWIASNYDLFFPETGSTMAMRLADVALVSRTKHPREGTIRFPEQPNVSKVIQIDADCK